MENGDDRRETIEEPELILVLDVLAPCTGHEGISFVSYKSRYRVNAVDRAGN